MEELGATEERLRFCEVLTDSAARVLEAGVRAARERGAFSSSLMGCREIQEGLAGLVSAAELLRLGARRVRCLLDRGERDRADIESSRLLDRALSLERDLRSVALALLGRSWVEAHLPADDRSSGQERIRQ